MAKQTRLTNSTAIIGTPQSGKTVWAVENFLINPDLKIYIDYNRAYLRLKDKHKWPDMPYVYGPWFNSCRQIWEALAQTKAVFYCPSTTEDIEALIGYLQDFKDKQVKNFERIWIYMDEADQYCKHGSRMEKVFTKYNGPELLGVAITQRIQQMKNKNIVAGCNGGSVFFNLSPFERDDILSNYGVFITDSDLAYIQEENNIKAGDPKRTRYNAVYMPRSGPVVQL